MQNIKKHIEMTPPPEGAPGMFRCAKPRLIADMFEQAGLKDVCEREINGKLNCDSAQKYWNFITEVAAPFVEALSRVDQETIEEIRTDVINAINHKYPENTSIDTYGLVIYGRK